MSSRTALHNRFLDLARAGDASRLAFLHGPEKTWTEEEVAALWKQALRRPISDMESRNCVYIHVPFCKSICNFCNYDRLQPSSPSLLKTWLARVLRSIEVIGPAVRPLTFHALYIGGGTPSVLPARMLHELLEALDRKLSWHRRASRKLEFDPAVMNRDRLEVLAAHGIKRLSFGIETLDPDVNARHNRGRQGIEAIERCFTEMRSVGISNVACDFLLGLEGTTPEGMLKEMETVLRRFRPSGLDVFMITPTHSYVTRHFGGSWEAFWEHIGRFEALVPRALPDLAARTGYDVRMGHGHHMKLTRRSPLSSVAGPLIRIPPVSRILKEWGRKYSYTALTSEARSPVNLLGFGRSARSVIFGSAAFAACDPDDNPAAEGAAHYVGNDIDVAAEARSFLVHLLRDSDTVDRVEFRRIFGGDMSEIIPTALNAWEKEGTARLEQDVLRFVPQERRPRIRSLLWLVPEAAIEFDLGHHDQLELSPSGVSRLVASIKPGTPLAGGHTFEGTDGIRVLIRTPEGQVLLLRLAPSLTDNTPLRLVLETTPATPNVDALRRAVGQLRSMLTHGHRKHTNDSGSRSSTVDLRQAASTSR